MRSESTRAVLRLRIVIFCLWSAKHDKVLKHDKNQLNKVEDLYFCYSVVGGCQAVAMQLLGCSGKVVTFHKILTKTLWPSKYFVWISEQAICQKKEQSLCLKNAFIHSILSTWMWISLIKIAHIWTKSCTFLPWSMQASTIKYCKKHW